MFITKIVELLELRNKLNKEKRRIDRKLFIINNLINTSWFIEDSRARQKESRRYWKKSKK